MDSQIIIDQSLPPSKRWSLTGNQILQTKELVATYVEDMGGVSQFGQEVTAFAEHNLEPEYYSELKSLANQCNIPLEEILLTNLYYDLFKVVIGCTAFAVDTPNGPIHACSATIRMAG